MEAKELRLGNWILDETKRPKQISLSEDDLWHTELFEPIPLTPEILEKAGFMKVEYYYRIPLFYKTDFLEIDDNFDLWMTSLDERIKLMDIEYLHQLQNLYWCLTGEELKVNLHEKRNSHHTAPQGPARCE